MPKEFSLKDIEKMITRIYLDMRMGTLYEDKACKETYILTSMLKAKELDFKQNRLEVLKKHQSNK